MPIDSALLELARNPGLTDLAEEIILDLQSMTVEELDLKTISEVHVPAEEIDQAVSAVVGDDDWRRALRRYTDDRRAPSADLHSLHRARQAAS
jgi:H2-forming N5,N10-methylenetetrahydromethanopterin dehydrogenase-like enzyme